MPEFKSGFIAIIGRPNVGKSTILNHFVGEKVAITSDKPQTTRNRILGVMTTPDAQLVFVDTPGIHAPRTRLGAYMVKSAEGALEGADIVLFVCDGSDVRAADAQIIAAKTPKNAKRYLVINKADIAKPGDIARCMAMVKPEMNIEEVVPISAKTGEGMDALLNMLINALPEGPRYFPDDQYTDHSERFLIAEIIREKALNLLSEEVPHGVGVDVLAVNEGQRLTEIHATILCDKASHKGIIIGKGGRMLVDIGSQARIDIEAMLDKKINLQLWVKVRENWRDRPDDLRNLGYD